MLSFLNRVSSKVESFSALPQAIRTDHIDDSRDTSEEDKKIYKVLPDFRKHPCNLVSTLMELLVTRH